MRKHSLKKLKFSAAFIGAVGIGGPLVYEAAMLNNLVWNGQNVGSITTHTETTPSGRKIDVYEMPVEVSRNGDFLNREDLSTILYMEFPKDSIFASYACLRQKYERAGIFEPNPDSPRLQTFLHARPHFRATAMNQFGNNGKTVINDSMKVSYEGDCDNTSDYLYQAGEMTRYRIKQLKR